ncbi:MAG: DUF11 domain-containing protein [Vicinamibacteria bacterium]|nr:DUF11 domain-containing protein [Vicinamibacteria bacterium]
MPGQDGDLTVSGVMTVNTYYPGDATVTAGATSITLGAARGATPIAAGDMLLVIQMQDANFNRTNTDNYGAANGTGRGSTTLNNAGRYEFVMATSAVGLGGGVVNIVGTGAGNGLLSTYTNAAADLGGFTQQGQRRFQVIRVPQYNSVSYGAGTTFGTLTALQWNGRTGGVLALDVASTMTLNADPVLSVQSLARAAYSNTAAVTVTVTTTTAHDYNAGDLVTIVGADQAPYNGTFPITSVTATTFTYTIVATWVDQRAGTVEYPATPATGTITATRHAADVTGRGFRGGGGRASSGGAGAYTDYRTTYANGPNGSKGEGIDGTPRLVFDPLNGAWDPRRITDTGIDGYPSGGMARGAPGNAGGGGTDGRPSANDQNSGGGGGGNGGIGGQGGNSWDSNYANGGIGGDWFASSADRIVMGGGGGAGSRNNSALSESSGGAGGGIVLIRAGSVVGTGHVVADGAQGVSSENDGGGGGGAGGTIVIATAGGGLSGVTARARGARGTDAWGGRTQPATNFPDERHGPGGGGGGGWILTTSAPASTDVSGGAPGVTTLANDIYGASPGAPGQSATISLSQIPGVNSGPECSADMEIVKSAAVASPTSLIYTLVVTNNGFWSAENATVTDALPAGTTYVSATSTIGACGWAGPAPGTVTCNLGAMDVGATATITIETIPPASGSLTNTGTVASTTPDPVGTNNSSTVVTTLSPPTDLGVTITPPADPLTAGSTAAYTITVVNNGPNAAPDATLTIPIPADATFQSMAPPNGWTCVTPPVGSGQPATIVCTLASAPVDPIGVVFSLVLGIPAGTPAGTVITLTAGVSTSGLDTDASNDVASVSNTVGPPIELLTRATIVGLRVRAQAGLVEFATGMQHGTVSFNVYATNDPQGHEGLMLLNDAPVLSPRPSSTIPILYSLSTDPITARYVVIEERDVKGRSQWAGPYSTASWHMRLAYERIEARFMAQEDAMVAWGSARSTSRSFSPRRAAFERRGFRNRKHAQARPWRREPRIPRHGIRIETSGAGYVSVLRSDLEAAGLPARAPLSRVRLSSRGRPVPFKTVGAGADESLRFLAEPLSTLYAGRNVYVATWGHDLPRMAVPLTNAEPRIEPGFVRVRKSTLYLSTTPLDHDPWFWDAMLSDGTTWPSPQWLEWFPGINEFALEGLLPASGDAPVRVALWTDVAGSHDVTVWINGVQVGDLSFNGAGDRVLQGRIAVSALRGEANVLEIGYAGVPDAPEALAYVCLRHVDIGAPVDPSARVAVARPPEAYDASLPDLRFTEYLIVTHPDFAGQAEKIARLKRAEGLRTTVVGVEQVYDHFSAGIVEAGAIHELVRTAARNRKLRFVLLIGADTYDPRDFVETGAVSYVPSLYGWDGEYGRVPSENRYADVDGDGKPDVAIGRLPVQTAGEADVLAEKISRQQATLKAAARRHVFVVDNGPPFRAEASAIAAAFPSAIASWSDLTNGRTAARQALWDAWRQGVALTHYLGHGGPEQWADERLADVEDAQSLESKESVFLTWTCMAQNYQYLWGPSINEAFLLNPNGGALASFGPAGLPDISAQAVLYARIYDELKTPGVTLGEAVRRGKTRAVADDALSIPAVEGFNLLGDPGLRLPGLGGTSRTAQRGSR